ncbi:hypothetical protein C3B44_01855 [Corynebacterium yudongzhengii]|uniref:Uncharacterized protein n=1 Tax=Corynebacterium yudongzhengii TaxID=2080740 RepID=A0A2U1T9V4_9CORY|nr:hypothetical protein [Corynebacterium yudongzhengii]AWB81240.1 hypothetical protein C3B44_01855 [Corynebacterium yudongzhengii]PWC02779.1 hypothetical protein DF222_00585 [Corynebacterium yudongzhengii]
MGNLLNLLFGDPTNPVSEIKTIFSQHDNPLAAAQDWAKKLLQDKDIDPMKSPLAAIKEVRTEEKAFNLKSATYLVEKLTK